MLNKTQIPIIWPQRRVISDTLLRSWCSDARANGELDAECGEIDFSTADVRDVVEIAESHGVITAITGWQNWS